jgi:CRISPR-associated protein Csy3
MKYKTLPSIFSVQRCMIISDAEMFNRIPDSAGGFKETPIQVIRHGILGTQNVVGKDKDVKNPQRTESAKTDPGATGMVVEFSMSTITLDNAVFACNQNDFRASVQGFIERFKSSGELREICNRYARNILNGRWLWRNRILGQNITVTVTCGNEQIMSDATARPHSTFGDYTDNEKKLGDLLMLSLTEKPMQFVVTGTVDFGMAGSFEVFPSQNYVSDKPKGFARSLYKLSRISRQDLIRIMSKDDADTYSGDIIDMGNAAIRDQKIGNAIRTIDTWYEGGNDATPIPVEPKGANIETNEVKRGGKNSLFETIIAVDDIVPAKDGEPLGQDAMFILANLVRGFLAGEKDESSGKGGKKSNKKSNDADEQADLLEEAEAQ